MTEHRGVCCALPRGLLAVAVDADADGLLLPRGPLLAGALLLAGPMTVKHLFVEGQQIIRDHAFAKLDLPAVIAEQNRLARNLM